MMVSDLHLRLMREHHSALQQRILLFITGDSKESFESLLLEVHDFQKSHNSIISAFASSFPKPISWQTVPAIPQEAFREFRIATFPKNTSTRVFHTSGTTGTKRGKHWFYSLELYKQSACSGWQKAGLTGYPILALLPPPRIAPYSSLVQMAAWLTPEENFLWGESGWQCLQRVINSTPVLLFGTALTFLDFFAKTSPLTLPSGSLVVETGGYKGAQLSTSKLELYKLFEQRLGIPSASIFNEYGMTELSSQFYANDIHTPHRAPPWARALVINPETQKECSVNETGMLRIFDLANLGSACVLQTHDLAIRRENGFELLGRAPSAIPQGCSRSY